MTNVIRIASKANVINVTLSFGDGYVKQSGEASVYVICYIQRKKVKFNTGVSIKPENWDPNHNRIRGNTPEVKDYNLIISAMVSRMNDVFVKYRLQGKQLTADLLKKEMKNPSVYTDFLSFMANAIEERRGELTDSTINQHFAALNKLKEYKAKVFFSELDADFFKKFNRWLVNSKKNSQNTRHNTFKTLKAYINIAIEKHIITTNPLTRLPVNKSKTDPVWLSEDELTQLITLYKKKFLPGKYQNVLRWFLFSCVTGLRISDVRRVKMEDIIGDRLVLVPQKVKNRNAKTVKIPVSPLARKLIEDESPHRIKGEIFNMLSDQCINLFLKDIMPVAKISKKVTFHTARHTFATYFLKKTKNLKALQDLLGHSRLSETMVYSHILAEEIDKEVDIAFGDL